jgi:para-nitrobenzyl esterase
VGTLSTPTGRVEGLDLGGVRGYLGIPYAAAPTGARRWQAPDPAPPWSGVLAATVWPPAPPQPATGTVGGAALPGLDVSTTNEDCLTLNVWSPEGASDAPVLVWLPGGAFVTGGAGIPLYDGADLARRQGVVVVSVTYRVGALGFAAVPGAAPNRGLLDQVAALQWVRHGIGEFGGDAGNVTAFGESAGGGSVLHLLAMPSARPLVRRAIVQSGATDYTLDPDSAAAVAERFLHALGRDLTAPIDRVLAAQGEAMMAAMAEVGPMPFHPFVDGDVITGRPVAAMRTSDIPLIIGTTRDEMRMFFDPRPLAREQLVRRVGRYLASRGADEGAADALVDLYDLPAAADVLSAVQTDGEMRRPADAMADAHARGGAPTFVYRFDEPLTGALADLWACHGSDLPYPFGAVDRCGWGEVVGPHAGAVSAAIQAAWATFARGEDPWPAYDITRRATMRFGGDDGGGITDDPDGERRRRWAELAPLKDS